MATEAITQLLDTSMDSVGLSIVSSQMTAEDLRHGSMYNSLVLAAGVPIWFHPLQDGQYVALFQSHWINATAGAGGPQSFTDFTEAGSCWVRVTPPSGTTVALGKIPTNIPGTDLVINGAATWTNYLYTVGSIDGVPIVQHHRVTTDGALVLVGEELMFTPGNNGVTFDKGCFIDGNDTLYLVVLGTDAEGAVYQARRRWARIGQLDASLAWCWQYRSAKGWLPDPTTLEPIGLTSAGPMSVARFKDRLLLSVVEKAGADRSGQIYATRQSAPFKSWSRMGSAIPLGTGPATETTAPSTLPQVAFAGSGSLDGAGGIDTYLGGTVYFQPQLGRNPALPMPEAAVAAIPYVSSVRLITGAEQAVSTVWGLWPVRSTV